jgi:uncharacterized protein
MTGNNISPVSPTQKSERYLSLDMLRGFALFGILAVNIQAFAMIFSSLANPTIFGDLTGLNYWAAMLTNLLASMKFITLFSLLFGAGVLLMTRNIERKGGKPAALHYRRMLWLILIGLLHAYVLWYGDILVSYGLCGLLVFLFRKMSPRKLLIIGLIGICVASLIFVALDWSLPYWPEEMVKTSMEALHPDTETIAAEVNAYRGGWWDQMIHRVPLALTFQTTVLLLMVLWRTVGVMLIGMALLKWGILTGGRGTECEERFDFKRLYWKFVIIGGSVGLTMALYGWFSNFRHHWSLDYSMFEGQQFNYWGSLFLAGAYIGGLMLLHESGRLSLLVRSLAAVGQMAFTNYLMQTVICTILFYGHGFGLFGKVNRVWQMLIVFLIFAFQMWLSPIWLKHFRFGPMEWVWRSLTYRQLQPMKYCQTG